MCGALALVVWSWAFAPGAAAQGVDVAITELDCNSDPEMIVVSNKGATPVDMTGWNLQSDPTTSESLPLQQFGSLSAGRDCIGGRGSTCGWRPAGSGGNGASGAAHCSG